MIPIAKQKILQIEVTNACPHRCSNCTRFSGHHRKPFFMDLETVERALDSVAKFPGMVGIMGGEPTIHPEFERIAELAASRRRPRRLPRARLSPIRDFTEYRNRYLARIPGVSLGLWSSLGEAYYRHFETIQETFAYQCINTHDNPGQHQAMLIASSELPIPAEERAKLIDQCWVNRLWSASITPKGAFFCEVAAALDMLFDGPGGWPIEPQWWTRPPDAWGDQRQWCELCGAAMAVPRRPAWDGLDDVSPGNAKRLEEVRSPKVRAGKIRVFDLAGYDPAKYAEKPSAEWYLPEGDNAKRVGTDRSLYPRKVEAILVCVGYADFLRRTLPGNVPLFDKMIVVTAPDDLDTIRVAQDAGAEVVVSDSYRERSAGFNKGKMMNVGARALDFDDWVLITDADIFFPPGFRRALDRMILNPGCLHYSTRFSPPYETRIEWLDRFAEDRSIVSELRLVDPGSNQRPWGYCQLFNVRAKAIRDLGRDLYSERFASAGGVDYHFHERWSAKRKILLSGPEFRLVHIPHGSLGVNWNGRSSSPLDPGYEPIRPKGAGSGWRNIGWISTNGFNRCGSIPRKGYLRLIRYDTSDFVVCPYYPGRRPGSNWIRGRFEFSAHHVGITAPRFEIPLGAESRGRVVIYRRRGREYSGYGMGHIYAEDNRQGYVWAGEEIGQTDFDVAWKRELDEEDLPHLIEGRI